MTVLTVWRDARRVGVLDTTPDGAVRFTYDADVAAEARPESAVGFRCPVRARPYTGLEAAAVFENLLPEGTLRSTLGQATKHDPGDTVGLLGVVGGECAGALQLWPEGESPPLTPEYDDVSAPAMSVAFTNARGQLRQVTGRASLSGAQPKLALWRMPPVAGEHPVYKLPRNGAPTTVVVKRPGQDFPGLLEAEMVGMGLMQAAGVETASSAPCVVATDCHESARFDRKVTPDGHIQRLHAEDGCQLTGRLSRNKYAKLNAPTYLDLCAVLNRASANPLEDREFLFRWAMANAAMGNYDAHAKNISVVYVSADRVRLAPAYDVVITAVHEAFDRDFALHFCGTTLPQALTRASLRVAAREFSLPAVRVAELADDVVQLIRSTLPDVLQGVSRAGGAPRMLDKLRASVLETSGSLAARLGMSMT
ncbi:MAG: HipA domain-containing protein [Gemmatimonadota bacterium]|nr:HipA domain-containing protein [Gemmatimonadota bacterium]